MQLISVLWITCCTCDPLSPTIIPSLPGRHVYSEVECGAVEGRRRGRARGAGRDWMDSCSDESLQQTCLPPPDFLFPVCSHGYTTRLRASSVCAYADLAVALWFITFLVDAHRSIRAHTSTLNPKAATAGDYRERKWLLKCLSPTHTALDREKVWITRYWLLQSISHLNSAKDPK